MNHIALAVQNLKMASQKQIDFIKALNNDRDADGFDGILFERNWDVLGGKDVTMKEASAVIDALLKAPRKGAKPSAPAKAVPQVDDGCYALREKGVVKFYRVNTSVGGRWDGTTWVAAQASDKFYNVREENARIAILTKIAKDPIKALRLYGTELKVCGCCGRKLTDETSRAFGIGPVCRGYLGV